MATKLYPPVIEGTIPAFCDSNLIVPFAMNRSVSKAEVLNLILKLKTVQSNYMFTPIEASSIDMEQGLAIFDLRSIMDKLNLGQFYKLQVAYEALDRTVGYYSTVGVVKYTSNPQVSILSSGDGITYIGKYSQNSNGDRTEKIYSYCFDLFDEKNQLIESSGEQLHNSSQDTSSFETTDVYTIKATIKPNVNYQLYYTIKTINGLTRQVFSTVTHKGSVNSPLEAELVADLNYEEGYIDVILKRTGLASSGTFILSRASSQDDYGIWNEVLRFTINGSFIQLNLWKDMTIQQGVGYKYAIQQYNNYYVKSRRIESNEVNADFDHAFLFDGQRQLKIKYNSKVASFKNSLLESKIDTIGSTHPFIFRNSSVKYKEFSISGLLSHLSDEESLFDKSLPQKINLERNEIHASLSTELNNERGTDFTANNTKIEREFKLSVLEWLTNGQPKLFRSPTEGNYVVRLVNVSLTPMDQLGRVLHTFNCTAYEIAEHNFSSLESYGMIQGSEPPQDLSWTSINMSENGVKPNTNLLQTTAVALQIEEMLPGEKIDITMLQNLQTKTITVMIGATGRYNIALKDNIEIIGVSVQDSSEHPKDDNGLMHCPGVITYAYYSRNAKSTFDVINDIDIQKIPCEQFIGAHDNIIDEISNFKERIDYIGYLRFSLRGEQTRKVYQKNKNDFTNFVDEAGHLVDFKDFIDIYKVYFYDDNNPKSTNSNMHHVWYDGYNGNINNKFNFVSINLTSEEFENMRDLGVRIYKKDSDGKYCLSTKYESSAKYYKMDGNGIIFGQKFNSQWTKVYINGEEKDIATIQTYSIKRPSQIKSIQTGPAIICDISYQKQIVGYDFDEKGIVANKKQAYLNAYNHLNNEYILQDADRELLKAQQDQCKVRYQEYLHVLENAVKDTVLGG